MNARHTPLTPVLVFLAAAGCIQTGLNSGFHDYGWSLRVAFPAGPE